jgi:DNA-binding NarL/FixJ family response regulator/Tfp pilus assembly protein PilF
MKQSLKSKKVLIVEDQATMRKAIREMIYGFDMKLITEAANGSSAIAAMRKESFDIVLCDYNLGSGKNGQQILEEARFRKLLPFYAVFIMVTAEQTQSMVLGAMDNKPDEYMTKPFNAEQLLNRIKRNISRKEYLGDIEKALDSGNISLAIAHCDKKLLENNRLMHTHLLKLRAQLAIKIGDFKKAKAIYQAVLEQSELNWATLGLGIIAYLQDDFGEAEAIFRKLIEDYPMMLEAFDWLAKTHEAQGDFAGAQNTLNEATALSPQAILRQQKLATMANMNGELTIAEKAYKTAIDLGKNSVHHSSGDFAGLAKIYSKTDAKSALKTLKDMRSLYFGNPEAELRAALLETEVFHQLADEESSVQAYQLAQKLSLELGNKAPTDLRLEMIKTSYLKGDDKAANKQLEQLIKNHADDDHFMGDVRKVLNETGNAQQGEKLIARIKKELVDINNKGVDLFKQGNITEATQVFQRAATTMPENKTIMINMVKILLHDLKTNEVKKEKIQRIQTFIDKASQFGVKKEKIEHLQAQLNNLSHKINSTASSE